MTPRIAATVLFLLVCLGTARAAEAPEALLDPNFAVPEHAAAAGRLQQRYLALAERLSAMEARRTLSGVDERLGELFLPDDPARFRRLYGLELTLAGMPFDVSSWLAIARQYFERGEVDDAASAAWKAWAGHPDARSRAAALTVMAEAYLARGESGTAINLYARALELEKTDERAQRLAALLERYRLRITDIALDVERDRPAVCVVFNQKLASAVRQAPEDYVGLAPAQDVDIGARDDRVCLAHGAELELLVKAGVTGADGGRLYAEARQRFTVPDRAERVSFARDAYVLPGGADDRLPMTSVNLKTAKLKVYRIGDRNLIQAVLSGLIGRDLYPGAEYNVGGNTGVEVWSGEVEIEARRNCEVVTLLPVAELLGTRKPGVYAVVGRPAEEDDRSRWREHATQWLVVSDVGLASFEGEDGLNVLARSLRSAEAKAAVRLTLVARNNTVLGSALTDERGQARFPPGLVRGRGGDRAALLVAETDAGDYNFLRLIGGSLELGERGVDGRAAPGPADAFLYPERGVYRPGETVHLSVLLRDQGARAMPGLPLTLKVRHPGGTEVFVKTATGDAFGGYGFELPLANTARAGTWTALAFLDPKASAVGSAGFLVEDFVPPRLEARLGADREAVRLGERVELAARGDFYYGAPAGGLEVEAYLNLVVDEEPFAAWRGYRFGLEQETFRPERRELRAPPTDGAGESRFAVELKQLPDSTHPLLAEVRATLVDIGGRPVGATLRLPVRAREVEVGLKPEREGGIGNGDSAGFALVALDAEGRGVANRRLSYSWVREHYDYNWYQQGGSWQTRVTVSDEVLAGGEVTLDAAGKGRIERKLGWGRYRVEIADADGNSAASYRFHAGWWSASRLPDVPDALELTLEKTALADGERLSAFVKAPFAGRAVLAVMGERLYRTLDVVLPAEGARVDLLVDRDWGPGAYLMVTAFRPNDGGASLLPSRAMGLAWFSIDRSAREVAVEIAAPETALPRSQVTLPLSIPAAAGRDLKLTLAAVDEGILSLTRFESPDPRAYFHGQRRLGIDVRDLYGYLIRGAEGRLGRLRSGGDAVLADLDNTAGPRTRTVETVALYRRDIAVDASGRAEVTLDLPDFNGRLRLMVVAYGAAVVGAGEAALLVRDPLVAELILPRFLAPGDEAAASLSLHNLSGKPLEVEVALEAAGALRLDGGQGFRVRLADGERRDSPLRLIGGSVGDGQIRLAAAAEGLRQVARSWDIAVRAAWPNVTRRQVTVLEPGQRLDGAGAATDEFFPDTLQTTVSLSARPDFDAPALLADLRLYPYGCNEQTVSQALPLLYAADLAEAWGAEDIDALDVRFTLDRAVLKLLDRQRGDGALSTWSAFGEVHPWLTAYAFDFLTQARERGLDVPPAAYEQMQVWLEDYALGGRTDQLYARAYALYVLARVGAVKASDVRYFADTHAGGIPTRLGLGHVAASLALFGEGARAEAMFEQAIAKRRPRQPIADYGSDLRDGAALAALLAGLAGGSDRRLAIAAELERRFDSTRWLSTQEEAWLLLATQALAGGDGKLQAEVAGMRVGPQTAPYRHRLGDGARAGIAVVNRGAAPVRVIVTRRGVPGTAPAAVDAGFELQRSYFGIDGGAVDLAAVRQNQQIVVLIEGRAKQGREHEALLVDLLPAGFEIENAALGGEGAAGRFDFLPPLTRSLFEAARDDRYIAAFDIAGDRRSFAFAYLVRAVTPGSYVLPGSFVEDMYKPEYHGRLAASRVTVTR